MRTSLTLLFFFLSVTQVFAKHEYYEIGANKIEIRDSDRVLLDQRDLKALSFYQEKKREQKSIMLYLKVSSLHKFQEITQGQKSQNWIVILDNKSFPVSLSWEYFYIGGVLALHTSVKEGFPLSKIRKNYQKNSEVSKPKRAGRFLNWLAQYNRQVPQNFKARRYLVFLLSQANKCKPAARLINQKYVDTFDENLVYFAGNCFLNNELYFSAVEFYTRLRRQYSKPSLLLSRAGAYYNSYQYPLALRDLNNYLKSSPQDEFALSKRVDVLVLLKLYNKAIRDCNILITKKPSSIKRYSQRADVFALAKQIEPAIKDYKTALKLVQKRDGPHPDDSELYHSLARLYVSNNRNLKEALRLTLKAHKFDPARIFDPSDEEPGNPIYQNTLAEIYLKLGRIKAAYKANQDAFQEARDPALIKKLRIRRKTLELRMKPR